MNSPGTDSGSSTRSPPEASADGAVGRWATVHAVLKTALLPLVLAGLGYLYQDYAKQRDQQEARLRLYTELLSRREQSESALRSQMFSKVIDTFVGGNSPGYETLLCW